MSYESTKAGIEKRADEIAAKLGPQPVTGSTPEFAALQAETMAETIALDAAIDKRADDLQPSDAIRILRAVRDHLPLVGPALALLGAGQDARSKASDASKILTELCELVGL